MDTQIDTMNVLFDLRQRLRSLLQPEILSALADLLEATGGDESNIDKYKVFVAKSTEGEDCRYARIAKELFLKNEAGNVAQSVNWLYENWSKFYQLPRRSK